MSESTLTHRIVGAVVLLSLAVIFIPILLEPKDDDPIRLDKTNIPMMPKEVESITFQVDEVGEFKKIDGEAVSRFQSSGEVTREMPQRQGDLPASTMDIDPQEKMPSPHSLQKVAPVMDPLPSNTSTWMVQLASFSKENNAKALQDRLRAKQFHVYVSAVEGKNGTIWRVRVGPELTKERAEAIRKVLQAETGLKGLLVKLAHGG